MYLWNSIISTFGGKAGSKNETMAEASRDASRFAFVDVEVGNDEKIHDIGATRWDGATFHAVNREGLVEFLRDVDFVCGHNIVHHDIRYLFGNEELNMPWVVVDTLYMSPLLFPERPYHHLLKDDKLDTEQMNNPVNDCLKARDLLFDEIAQWAALSDDKKMIYAALLGDKPEFMGFLTMVGAPKEEKEDVANLIGDIYRGLICEHAQWDNILNERPVALAYALALVGTTQRNSTTPPWVLHTYPEVEGVIYQLRHVRCQQGCEYCNRYLDVNQNLKRFFGYDGFRTYDDEPLQESAVRAAVEGQSLLAIFPTGGGKSLTFQLPALMASESVRGLTVVISPLQSLMKDQVDNLAQKGIADAVTINGLLDPISRSVAIERVMNGDASLLYIAPEMLRSNTIERLLLARNVVRFVIDEAHCFSSWGQDFRVDYLYIGKFIKQYQERKRLTKSIPVSCFTATAKQKVVQDICDYFKETLGQELKLFATSASRTNLHYSVIHAESDEDKYTKLRSLIAAENCPTIVYVSRTKRTRQLAQKLTRDGYKALPFNGKMDSDDKVANQEAFMREEVRIIVATSAFGMGVDKSNVGLVVHYDISDSLENYVQEAGRAGRDPHLDARCFVLYADDDLDKHFILLNQTKLSISEIQQIWKAVKDMTRYRNQVCCSALEIARKAGWDDSVADIETRVRTAIAALEQAGYLERGNNMPQIFATGIRVKNVEEARKRISESVLFEDKDIETAVRIIKSLISKKHTMKSTDGDAESRIDYLADILGLGKHEVVSAVERMRLDGILANSKDISAFLQDDGRTEIRSRKLLNRFNSLERYVLNLISDDRLTITLKQLNDEAQRGGIATATEKDIRTLLYFLTIKGYIRKTEDVDHNIEVVRVTDKATTIQRFEKRLDICNFAIEWLYRLPMGAEKRDEQGANVVKNKGVQFSVVDLMNDFRNRGQLLFSTNANIDLDEVEEALFYLSTIGALKLEGGFMVLYNPMSIERLKDSKLQYKKEDYRMLDEFYKQKIQQVHIVGEYANLMVRNYDAALGYVKDYFQMDYNQFIHKYFRGERKTDIERNITKSKYNKLFGQLSAKQMEIIGDKESRVIVVAAGPGSGKTRVLVHKLASLLLMEDVKHEQLLMLTFSRAAATEFKLRLLELIGNAAHYVEIKTFHSYCFDLLGRIGNLEDAQDVVQRATQMIAEGDVEPNRISKTVLVIDEAQDMSKEEYDLVCALMTANDSMRVIAVGDDDQNIFEFRGSDSRYMKSLLSEWGGRLIEMTENYRSTKHVVAFANAFVQGIGGRMKQSPIVAVSKDEGNVSITQCASAIMYQRIVSDILKNNFKGDTIAVLTQKNEEALIMVALLRKHGIKSKLIQSMDGFAFGNLAEVRYFIKQIEQNTNTTYIGDDVWNHAKEATMQKYGNSRSLDYLIQCLGIFERTNKNKYLTDFKEMVYESTVDDFCDVADADVVVSTIHKAKGREFDDVFLFVAAPLHTMEEDMRRLYVGMTRSKKRLFIYTNSQIFNPLTSNYHTMDTEVYAMPNELTLQLTHKDVNLNFFKGRKRDILALRAGDELSFDGQFLSVPTTNVPVAQLSKKMMKDLDIWLTRGYMVCSANIRFVVAWRPKNEAVDALREREEYAVLLVDLEMKKND